MERVQEELFGLLEVEICLVSIREFIFRLLVSDIGIDHVYIESCGSDEISS